MKLCEVLSNEKLKSLGPATTHTYMHVEQTRQHHAKILLSRATAFGNSISSGNFAENRTLRPRTVTVVTPRELKRSPPFSLNQTCASS